MFCTSCGYKLPEGVYVCPRCGNQLNLDNIRLPQNMMRNNTPQIPSQHMQHSAFTSYAMNAAKPDGKMTLKKILLLAVAVVFALCAVILVLIRFGGGGYKATVEKLVKCRAYADAELKYSVMTPDYLTYLEKEWSNDKQRVLERFQSSLDDNLRDYQRVCGEVKSVSTVISNDYHFSADDLASLNRYMKSSYQFEENVIKDAHIVEVHFTLHGSNGDYTNYFFQLVMKVRGKWTAIAGHMDLDFLRIDWLDKRYLN